MKNITDEKYKKIVDNNMPKSSLLTKSMKAFLSGGCICLLGQIIFNLLSLTTMSKDSVSTYTSIILIFIGAFLTGADIYNKIAKFAGAGSLIPITGFANAIVSPAIEFKSEGYILGLGTKMFIIAGPVLVYGVTVSIMCGFILFISERIM